MNIFSSLSETPFARYCHHAALIICTLLSITSLAAYADDIQGAYKLYKQGQHVQALDKVNDFLSGKPRDAQARFLKGLILNEQGNTAEAIEIFSALTEEYPELPEPYNNLAVLYAGQGKYDNARLALEMAIRAHPDYATAHENLGDIHARMASQAYGRAMQLDKNNKAAPAKLKIIQDMLAGGTGKAARSEPVQQPAKQHEEVP